MRSVMAPAASTAPLYLDEELMDALMHVLPEDVGQLSASEDPAAEQSSPSPSELSSSSTEQLQPPEPQLMASDSFADFIESVSFNDEYHNKSSNHSKDTDELAGVPRKRPRSGRRQELDCLRDESDALERTLSQLRKRSIARQPGTGYFWEQIAHRIMVEKRQALRENARLRSLIREQVDSVKALQIAVGKTPELSRSDIRPSQPATSNSRSKAQGIYEKLFVNVAASYDALDTMFGKESVDPPSSEGRRKLEMDMRSENGLSLVVLRLEEERTLPLSYTKLGDQVWKALCRVSKVEHEQGFYRSFKRQGDYLFGECKIVDSTDFATMSGHVVMRRFEEKDRLTFVWESVGAASSSTSNSLPMLEKGWCLLEPSPDDPLNAAVYRMRVHFSPQVLTSPAQDLMAHAREIGSTTEVALCAYEKTVGCVREAVLASLMEEAGA